MISPLPPGGGRRWVVTGPAGAASLMVTPWPGGAKHCPVGASRGGGREALFMSAARV